VFHRPLALKLLAPTVFVSVAYLIGACGLGAWYLNKVHENSAEISENVDSTLAAQELETTTRGLIKSLSEGQSKGSDLTEIVTQTNKKALDSLEAAEKLANLPREKELVDKIDAELHAYLQHWRDRPGDSTPERADYDRRLAAELETGVLGRCNELRRFNLGQIAESSRKNQDIVKHLIWGIVIVGLGTPLSGILLGFAIARSLGHSIYQLSVAIRDAAGRLNCEVGPLTLAEGVDLPDLHRQMKGIISEIERVVEQLQQRDRELLRAEQLAAVGQVAAGVAHELRNPLTSVKMLVQTGLEGQTPQGLPPEDLAIIEHEIKRIEHRIQTFLDLARPPRSERRQADLISLLRGSLSLVEGRAQKQKVNIMADLPEPPVSLLIDSEQINQVFVNLLLNALDALPRGGTIVVQVDLHEPEQGGSKNGAAGSADGRGQVTVRITDSGAGIAPRIQDRLFQPFVTSKETGMGLGLSICKRLVEAHGGTIRGDNRPEGGAEFAFTLPA